jgi:hypothetical protein
MPSRPTQLLTLLPRRCTRRTDVCSVRWPGSQPGSVAA